MFLYEPHDMNRSKRERRQCQVDSLDYRAYITDRDEDRGASDDQLRGYRSEPRLDRFFAVLRAVYPDHT